MSATSTASQPRRVGAALATVRHRASSGVVALVSTVLLLFLFAPAALIAVLSFSDDVLLHFPPQRWGLRQYSSFFTSPEWIHALVLSLEIALPAALLALVVGVPLTVAIYRTRVQAKPLLLVLGVAPLVLPGVSYAVAVYTVFARVHLVGNPVGLVLVHATLGLPFVLLVVGTALQRIPDDLELVAMSLGASRQRAIVGITMRGLLPAIVGAFILAFITSFDEAVLVIFVGGPGLDTLPKAIYSSLKTGVEPLITAIATILMLGTGLLVGLGGYLEGRRR